jgi:hypothetical protein
MARPATNVMPVDGSWVSSLEWPNRLRLMDSRFYRGAPGRNAQTRSGARAALVNDLEAPLGAAVAHPAFVPVLGGRRLVTEAILHQRVVGMRYYSAANRREKD